MLWFYKRYSEENQMKPKIFVLIILFLVIIMLFPFAGLAANNNESNRSEIIFYPWFLINISLCRMT